MLRSLAMVSWLVFRSTTACNMCTILFVPIVLIQSLCNLYWILQVVFNQVPRKSIYAFYNKYEKLVTGSPYSLQSLLVTPIVTMSYVMCETGFPGNISVLLNEGNVTFEKSKSSLLTWYVTVCTLWYALCWLWPLKIRMSWTSSYTI